MGMRRYLAAFLACGFVIHPASESHGEWSFQGLGILEGEYSSAYAISGNGSVVVGAGWNAEKAGRPFRWQDGVITAIPWPDAQGTAEATAVSADGSIVIIAAVSARGPLRWQDGAVVELPAGPLTFGYASDVSSDGSVVVGYVDTRIFDPPEGVKFYVDAAVWERGAQPGTYTLEVLRDLTAFPFSYDPDGRDSANALSADGSLIVGSSEDRSGNSQGVYWKKSSSWRFADIIPLGTLGGAQSAAYDVSADGSVIVGWAERADGLLEAFRWENEAMVGLGTLGGDWLESLANAVSGDGSVVVGYAFKRQPQGALDHEPLVWDQAHGIRSLTDLLTQNGIDLSDWDLYYAVDISADGRVIVGNGYHISLDRQEAWIATIPEPSTLTGLATLAAALLLTHFCRKRVR